jgi:hypothetical protein
MPATPFIPTFLSMESLLTSMIVKPLTGSESSPLEEAGQSKRWTMAPKTMIYTLFLGWRKGSHSTKSGELKGHGEDAGSHPHRVSLCPVHRSPAMSILRTGRHKVTTVPKIKRARTRQHNRLPINSLDAEALAISFFFFDAEIQHSAIVNLPAASNQNWVRIMLEAIHTSSSQTLHPFLAASDPRHPRSPRSRLASGLYDVLDHHPRVCREFADPLVAHGWRCRWCL